MAKKRGDDVDYLKKAEAQMEKEVEQMLGEPAAGEAEAPIIEHRSTETRSLTCILTEDERRQRANTMAECLEQQEKLTGELDAFKAAMKGAMQELTGRLARATTEYRTGQCFRNVDVEKVYSLTDGVYRETRIDTAEVIAERPLTQSERQMRFA